MPRRLKPAMPNKRLVIGLAVLFVFGTTVGAEEAISSLDPAGCNLEELDPKSANSLVVLRVQIGADVGDVKVIEHLDITGAKFHEPDVEKTVLRAVKLRDAFGLREPLKPGEHLLLVNVIRTGETRWHAPIFKLNGMSLAETAEAVGRFREGKVEPRQTDSAALAGWMTRIRWRIKLSDKENHGEIAREILVRIKIPEIVPLEKKYLLKLLKGTLTGQAPKESALAATVVMEKERDIGVRTEALRLLYSLAAAPSRLDLDALRKIMYSYCEWWDEEVLRTASLVQRADYCNWAFKVKESAEYSIPLMKQHILKQTKPDEKTKP